MNNSSGCFNLGVLYYNGKGVEKDLTKAYQLYSKACKLGDQEACKTLKELK
ncbi:tetratricopeptide repeat protein [Helicobacter pylori]|uniref:tetratricopeptide repeat protein n=1 Tax=Helicobacter pylori TaxID=210 RepID=UPI0039C98ACD